MTSEIRFKPLIQDFITSVLENTQFIAVYTIYPHSTLTNEGDSSNSKFSPGCQVVIFLAKK
jgi:hypothetical protein